MPTPLAAATIDTTGAIRKFADSGVMEAVNKALNSIPPGRRISVIAEAGKTSARGMVVFKIGSEWSVVGALNKTYNTRGVDGQIAVVWSK